MDSGGLTFSVKFLFAAGSNAVSTVIDTAGKLVVIVFVVPLIVPVI